MQARRLALTLWVAGTLGFAVPASAAPAKPKNATAKCTDGTYSTAKTHAGACSGHGGVDKWYKEPKAESKATKSDARPAPRETRPAPPATRPAPREAPPAPRETRPAPRSTPDAPAPKTSARPTGSPADATAQCNDGTYSYAKHHQGACSNHHGVKTWFK